MKQSLVQKAHVELTTLIEEWLDKFDTDHTFPHLPGDTAVMMARQAFTVIEILAAGEQALSDDGFLVDS